MQSQNLTLSLPRKLVKEAKVLAAKRETSVSALIAAELERLVREEDDYDLATERMLARMRRGWNLGTHGKASSTRDELHDRTALR